VADLGDDVDRIAADSRFSGVVRVDRAGGTELARAYGQAHRGLGVANTVDTRFGIASASKGFTALTVMSLVEEGRLALGATARSLLGDDLPLIDDAVTVAHLLEHRSGIGDYIDEEAGGSVTEYVLPVPVHRLATTEDYLAVLDGHPQKFPPGERFAYNNSGFVVLALLAERAGGAPFADLVRDRMCGRAGMADTAYLRTDEPAGRAALGYLELEGLRTNQLHLPVVGSGDGGAWSTAADVHAFWSALFAGRIVAAESVQEVVRPRSDVPDDRMRYGRGFWLHRTSDAVVLEGHDAGVSFRTVHDPAAETAHTVLSNSSDGAWPLARFLYDVLNP
jgi:CubicO group peptidase (beta-lactamase class C family)